MVAGSKTRGRVTIPNGVGLTADQRQVNWVIWEDPIAARLPCTARDMLGLKASGEGHVLKVGVCIDGHARVSSLQGSRLQFALVVELRLLATPLLQHFRKTDTVGGVATTTFCEIGAVHGVVEATLSLSFGHHTSLVEAIKLLLLRKSLFERLQLAELTHRVLVQLVDTLERIFTDRLLVISEKQTTELT